MTDAPTTRPPAAIEVRGLLKRYRSGFWMRRRTVLDGLDLRVPPGATFGLVGPNGSGKSTLLRLLAGLESPDRGTLAVCGHDPRSDAARQALGFCPERIPYPEEFDARTLLRLIDRALGMPPRDRHARVDAWLERVGLSNTGRKPLGDFSSGMQRRFALAATFLNAPRVVLLDEPGAGLDAEGLRLLGELLNEARAGGSTVLVASHVPGELHAACDAIAVLVEGRIATVATPEHLALRARKLELEVERLDGESDLEALGDDLARRSLRLAGARPAATELDALYRELARESRRE